MPTNNSEYFNRVVKLQLGDQQYTDLRVNFKVKKTIKKSLNKATIEAYNLPPNATPELNKRELFVELQAGYGDEPTLIFRGNPVDEGITVERDRGDSVTEIEASDGLKEYQTARVNVSVAGPTALSAVVERIVDQTAWSVGQIDIPIERQLTQGVTLHGSARKALDRMARTQGVDWSIQNGQVYFVAKGETTDRGPLFSPDLNNILELREKDKDRIEVVALLTPINPGNRLKIEGSDGFDGVYKARSVEHKGDSGYKKDFHTTIVCE